MGIARMNRDSEKAIRQHKLGVLNDRLLYGARKNGFSFVGTKHRFLDFLTETPRIISV